MGTIILILELLFWLALLALGFINPWLFIFWVIYFIILFLSWVKIVSPQTVRTKEVFGKYTWILRQGLNLVIPFITITRKQDLFKKNFYIDIQWISYDNFPVYLRLNVIYYVNDDGDNLKNGNIYKSVYLLDDPEIMIRAEVNEWLLRIIKDLTKNEILEKKEKINNIIKMNLTKKLKKFGYNIDKLIIETIIFNFNKETIKSKDFNLKEIILNKFKL